VALFHQELLTKRPSKVGKSSGRSNVNNTSKGLKMTTPQIPPRLALFLETLGMHPDFLIWTRPSDLADEPPF